MNMPRELPSLNALRAFETAARLESVSAAGNELHVTHGAVSRQIRALEAELGVALFRRQGRGLALTPAGMRLRDTAATAFEQIGETTRELRHGAAEAPFVLGCPGSLLARWVIPRLDRLSRELPGLKLHLSASEGPPDPNLPGLDAALLLAEPPWPVEWRVHVLAAEWIGPVFSPRHPDAGRLRAAPAASLRQEALLHTSSRPQAWPSWSRAEGLPAQELRMGQGFEHLYYLLEAAVAGLGVAIAPRQLVADDLAAGRLLAPWGFRQTTGHWILCTPHRSITPHVDALVAWLRQELGDD